MSARLQGLDLGVQTAERRGERQAIRVQLCTGAQSRSARAVEDASVELAAPAPYLPLGPAHSETSDRSPTPRKRSVAASSYRPVWGSPYATDRNYSSDRLQIFQLVVLYLALAMWEASDSGPALLGFGRVRFLFPIPRSRL
jgi:hypothetical protein